VARPWNPTPRAVGLTLRRLSVAIGFRMSVPSPTSSRYRLIFVVGSLTTLGPLCIDLYLPALPAMSHDLSAAPSTVQVSLTASLVGTSVGQVLFGTFSDRLGRRRPLFIGLTLFILGSLACSLAPNVWTLIGVRVLQGFGGGAGIVVARAVVRDMYSGVAAARYYSVMAMLQGVAPVVGPQVGALLLRLGSWRFLFDGLALAGLALLTGVALRLPETLPPSRRSAHGLRDTLSTMGRLILSRTFTVNAVASGCAFAAGFAYIAGSSFALEDVYGVSPQAFGFIFAANAVCLAGVSQVNGLLVTRLGPYRLLTVGVSLLSASGTLFVVIATTGSFGLAGTLLCMSLVMCSLGLVGPNAIALALNDHPDSAGTAAALLGVLQYGLGGIAAPLVGLGGGDTVVPMAVVIAACACAAVAVRLTLRTRADLRAVVAAEA